MSFIHHTLTYAAFAFPVALVLAAVAWAALQMLDGEGL